MSKLNVYNTLTNKTEEFEPQNSPEVRMYVCGPTVYDDCHVGHARAYVSFDVIRRFLEYEGYRVKYVQNFTDIDDKTINRAKEEAVPFREIAERYTRRYFDVMDAIGVQRADLYPTVSGHVEEVIDHVQGLIEAGMAYQVEGDVYYRVKEFANYGCLSGQDIEEMLEGERVEPSAKKESPLDFALWKRSPEDEPGWESPWGRGRPGWHIECSVMGRTHLGDTIDIHGGGQDLIFPHHENEIAQTEGLTGSQFVKYWLHNGFVTIDDDKMSKSLGNFYTLEELYEQFSPAVIRYFILTRQYRNPIDFSFGRIEEAGRAYTRLKKFFVRLKRAEAKSCGPVKVQSDLPDNSEFREKFLAAMRADFNTARALGEISSWMKQWNETLESWRDRKQINRREQEAVTEARHLLDKFTSKVLGLELVDTSEAGSNNEEDLIELLIELRSQARENGDYERADEIRERLRGLGYELHDSSEGTRWELKNG